MKIPQEGTYAIYPTLEIKEFDTVENASKSDPLFIVKKIKSYVHTTVRKFQYDVYDFIFYNKEGSKSNPSYRNWKVASISKGSYNDKTGGWHSNVTVKYADPNGEIKVDYESDFMPIIKNLFKYGNYNNWRELELQMENERLKKEIERLKS